MIDLLLINIKWALISMSITNLHIHDWYKFTYS